MATIIKNISDGTRVEFDSGRLDDWCVFVTRKGQPRFAPTDTFYFTELNRLAEIHTPEKIYADFIKIYNRTGPTIDPEVLLLITEIAHEYGNDKTDADIWFTVIYAGMIAEENKKNAILKKRVKRLGLYHLLVQRKSPEYAASFSRGKTWREIDSVMQQYGF